MIESLGILLPSRADRVFGAIVAVARLGPVVESRSSAERFVHRAYGPPPDAARDARAAQWFSGPYGWILEDVVAVDPIACAGALGMWRVRPDVREQLFPHLKAA